MNEFKETVKYFKFLGTIKDPKKFAKGLEEKYGFSTAQNFFKILEGFPINSLNKDILRNIREYSLLFDEKELYDFIDNFLKLPEGSLEDDFSVKKFFEETESTKILMNTPFVPQNDGSWILSGKDVAKFGGIKGLIEKGFKKQLIGTMAGETILTGPDGSKFSAKISDIPVAKIILKQLNEGFKLNKIDSLPNHHYTLDLIKDIMINEKEIFSAYLNSDKNLKKTLEKLISYNDSWKKIYDIEGEKYCLKLLKKHLSKKA